MKVSIVIVNWNSVYYLKKCLDCLCSKSSKYEVQTVVVDAASYDGAAKLVSEEFPRVEFIQLHENVGFGVANNEALHAANGDVLVLLNPDCEVSLNALDILVDELLTLNGAGIVGPRLLNSDGSLQTSCVNALPTAINRALDCEVLRRLFPRSKLWGTFAAFSSSRPVTVGSVSGACMAMRRDLFVELGGFCPAYFMYCEDIDLCARVQHRGYYIYHVPHCSVVHHGGTSSISQGSTFSAVMMRRSAAKYFLMHHGAVVAFAYRFSQGLVSLLRTCIAWIMVLISTEDKKAKFKSISKRYSAVCHWAFCDYK